MAQLVDDVGGSTINTLSDYIAAKTQSRSTVALQNCDLNGNCNPLKTEMKVKIKVNYPMYLIIQLLLYQANLLSTRSFMTTVLKMPRAIMLMRTLRRLLPTHRPTIVMLPLELK